MQNIIEEKKEKRKKKKEKNSNTILQERMHLQIHIYRSNVINISKINLTTKYVYTHGRF